MSAEPLSNVVPLDLQKAEDAPERKNERAVYRLIEASLGLVGGIDSAAKIMGIDRGDLRRALDDKGRYLAVEHVMRFAKRLRAQSPEAAQRIAVGIMQPFNLLVFPREQITAAERARRYENKLRAMGAAIGIDLVGLALETPAIEASEEP